MSDTKRKLYCCDVCRTTGEWGEDWAWFGSYEQIENGDRVIYVCSDECYRKLGNGEPEIVFEDKGEIVVEKTYHFRCGLCGDDSPFESRKDGQEAGWTTHPQGGWLCPQCSTNVALRENARSMRSQALACPAHPWQ